MTRGPSPSIQNSIICSICISLAIFFQNIILSKNWQGGGELLHWTGPELRCAGSLALGEFCNIFLPNIGEDQKCLTI